MGIETAIAAVSALAGVAGTAHSVSAAKKQEKRQNRAMAQQRTEARETARKRTTRESTGAKVRLGSRDPAISTPSLASAAGIASSGSITSVIGGLKPTSASQRVGIV